MSRQVLPIVLGLLTACCTSVSQEVRPSLDQDESTQFRIFHFSYGENGQLRSGPGITDGLIQSLYYGAPIEDFEYVTELAPSSEAVPDKEYSSSLKKSIGPARPPTPQFQLDQWTTKDGLPANKVRAIYQTRNGYLWVGTEAGIARFDGHRFLAYSESNSPALRTHGSMGRAFYEDEGGRLWIGMNGGLLCFDQNEFIEFSGYELLSGVRINALVERTDGGFWIASDDGVVYWDGESLQHLNTEELVEAGRIVTLLDEGDGKLWIGSANGLLQFDLSTQKVNNTLFRPGIDFKEGEQEIAVFGLLKDNLDRLWIGTDRIGVWRLNPKQSVPIKFRSHLEQVFGGRFPKHARFAKDHHGNVWATAGGMVGGVLRFSGEFQGTEVPMYKEKIGETFAVFTCREGGVWIAGREGLFRIRTVPFATFGFDGIGGRETIRYVSEGQNGTLWFGGRRFFGRWNGGEISLFDVFRLIPAPSTSALYSSPDGSVWAGYPSGGILSLPENINSPRIHDRVHPQFSHIGELQAICQRDEGGLLLGTRSGVYEMNAQEELTPVKEFSGFDVSTVCEDGLSSIWAGTSGSGVLRLKDGLFKTYTSDEGLLSNSVSALYEGTDGIMWIGTTAGLNWIRKGMVFPFDVESGLPQRNIDGIVEDDFGRVWVSHDAGISCASIEELIAWSQDSRARPAVAEYGNADGMLSVQGSGSSSRSCLKSSDGRLWFAKRGGLIVVEPAALFPEAPAPHVIIEELTANGTSHDPGPMVILPPGSAHELIIKFTTTSLHSPEKTVIQYQLEGHDSGWIEADSVRKAVYSNLPPGDYRFRVRARNHEGRWSEVDAVLALHVAPHFWQTWVFQAGCGFATLAIASGLTAFRLRNQRRRLEAERLDALQHERARIARDIHDHLGAQLAESALAPSNGEQAHLLAKESLRELSDLIWSVDPKQDTLQSLIDFIGNFSSRYLSSARLKLDLNLPEELSTSSIDSRTRLEIAAAFKESLHNVVKHARATTVSVTVERNMNSMRFIIRDDGCGFDPKLLPITNRNNGTGNGLSNLQTRASLLGGTCHIDSTLGKGTAVELVVPIQNSNAGHNGNHSNK